MSPLAILLVLVVAMPVIAIAFIHLRRWRQGDLRREIRGNRVIFRAAIRRMKTSDIMQWLPPVQLVTRVESIEISSPLTFIRVMFGLECYFRAADVSVKVEPISSLLEREEWLVVRGLQFGKELQVDMTIRGDLLPAWNALVEAGAAPVGPSPRRR